MKKRFLFGYLGLSLISCILLGAFVYVCVNPNDAQYKAFNDDIKAHEAFVQKDIDTFFKYKDNPVTIKNHLSFDLAYAYADVGRTEDAIRVLTAYEPSPFYHGYCAAYNAVIPKFTCRLFCASGLFERFFNPIEVTNLNSIYAHIYYKQGDYKKAIEYVNQANLFSSCLSAKYYARDGQIDAAKKLLKNCANDYIKGEVKGIIALQKKDYQLAEKYLLKQINLNCEKKKDCTSNNEKYLLLAELYKQWGKNDLSEKYAKYVLETVPYSVKAQSYLKK